MRDSIWEGILRHIHETSGVSDLELIEVTPGFVKASVPITEKEIGRAHV